MTHDEAVVEVEDLRKAFGTVQALRGVRFRVTAGETYALLGPNGAGKSTVLNLILGFLRPDAGTVRLFGQMPYRDGGHSVRRWIAYVPDQTQLYGDLNAFHHLELFGTLGRDRRPDRAEMERVLETVRLPSEAWARRVKTYSHGMLRKLAIACALVRRPRLLILDEPTLGLDPVTIQDLIRVLVDFKTAGGSVLLATQDLLFVEHVADRAGLMRAGEMVLEWDREAIRQADLRKTYLEWMAAS
jgi:ABC-2 type transport system ATP-binding protein